MSVCEILETVDYCQVSPLDAMASLFGRTTFCTAIGSGAGQVGYSILHSPVAAAISRFSNSRSIIA